jgi:hypothetical protein
MNMFCFEEDDMRFSPNSSSCSSPLTIDVSPMCISPMSPLLSPSSNDSSGNMSPLSIQLDENVSKSPISTLLHQEDCLSPNSQSLVQCIKEKKYAQAMLKLLHFMYDFHEKTLVMGEMANESGNSLVNLTNTKQVWIHLIGQQYHLSQAQYNKINHWTQILAYLLQETMGCYSSSYNIFYQCTKTKATLRQMYHNYKRIVELYEKCKGHLCLLPALVIQSRAIAVGTYTEVSAAYKDMFETSVNQKNEGEEWLIDLLYIYATRLHGNLPCTPHQMMKHFKFFHRKLSDNDFFQLTSIIESHFGNTNLSTITANFWGWLSNNGSSLPAHVIDCFILS